MGRKLKISSGEITIDKKEKPNGARLKLEGNFNQIVKPFLWFETISNC
jgi:hypothetical protein